MPDITMCRDVTCPKRTSCYRYMATPCERQSFFARSPMQDGKCEYFWQVSGKVTDRDDKLNKLSTS